MKFFWKIFFTTMFVSMACWALGGYILVNSNFRTLLNNEVQTAYDYGDIVYYSLANELKQTKPPLSEYNEKSVSETVEQIAQSININNMNQKVSFGMIDKKGKVIFSSLAENIDKNAVFSLKQNQKEWTLKKTENSIYIQTLRPAVFYENTFYIETLREAAFIFDSQKSQYKTLLKIMIGMLGFAGAITFIISKFLMGQIVSLTKATENISAGNFSKRVVVNGNDEFTMLSENFNRMADNLEEKIYQLQQEADRKELFVGAFSHELKTPLTSIIGYADMLRRKQMQKEQLHICAQYIFTEGKRLETLSMRLLDLIVLKKQKVLFIPTDMGQLLDEVCFVFLPQLKKLNIELLCHMEYAVIALEPDLMKTVFINIIDNSQKAIDSNGQICIKGWWQEDIYTISVHDTGKGMKQEELSKIKEAFYMVDKSRTRQQGGCGLGLAICDEILKLHGFFIAFESVINEGTTISVTIKGGKK